MYFIYVPKVTYTSLHGGLGIFFYSLNLFCFQFFQNLYIIVLIWTLFLYLSWSCMVIDLVLVFVFNFVRIFMCLVFVLVIVQALVQSRSLFCLCLRLGIDFFLVQARSLSCSLFHSCIFFYFCSQLYFLQIFSVSNTSHN